MSFVLVHIRPDEGRIAVLSSQSPYVQQETTEESAFRYLKAASKNSDRPYLVVVFREHLPVAAYAMKGGVRRDLQLVIADPIPDDPTERFLGGRAGLKGIGPPVSVW